MKKLYLKQGILIYPSDNCIIPEYPYKIIPTNNSSQKIKTSGICGNCPKVENAQNGKDAENNKSTNLAGPMFSE